MIAEFQMLGNVYKMPRYIPKSRPESENKVAAGIKLRIGRMVSALFNVDLSRYQELEQAKYFLINVLNTWDSANIVANRVILFRLLSLIDQYLPQLSDMDLTARSYSAARSSASSASTVSGNAVKPPKAGKAQINKKNPKAKFSKQLLAKNTSGITDYMPWIIIAGIALVVLLQGKSIAKKRS